MAAKRSGAANPKSLSVRWFGDSFVVARGVVLVDQVLLNLQTSVLVLPPVHTNAVRVVLVKTLLLVMVVKSCGQILGLTNVDSCVGVATVGFLTPLCHEVDGTVVLLKVGAPRIDVEFILRSRRAGECNGAELCRGILPSTLAELLMWTFVHLLTQFGMLTDRACRMCVSSLI